jgi:hypothetical protein
MEPKPVLMRKPFRVTAVFLCFNMLGGMAFSIWLGRWWMVFIYAFVAINMGWLGFTGQMPVRKKRKAG